MKNRTVPFLASDIKHKIHDLAASIGFDAVAFADFKSVAEGDKAIEQWTSEGRHGSMQYLADIRKRRERLEAEIPDAKSVIVLGMNYFQGPSLQQSSPLGFGP